MHFLTNKSLAELNDHLCGDNILNHFKVREKLLSLSYEELSKINEQLKIDGSLLKLNNLTTSVLFKMEDENLLLL